MELGVLLAYQYPHLKVGKEYLVKDDGSGAFIAKWEASEPQPTDEELQIAWDEYIANPPEPELAPVEDLQKQHTDLVFQLMMGGVL